MRRVVFVIVFVEIFLWILFNLDIFVYNMIKRVKGEIYIVILFVKIGFIGKVKLKGYDFYFVSIW